MIKEHSTDLIERKSELTFEATLERISTALAKAGITIFAKIDHAAGARDAGLAMPPTTVLIYGNPKGGTPIMLAAPNVALDLPLRVLVREDDDGKVIVAFHPARSMLEDAGVREPLASRLDPAQHLILEALSS